MRAMFKTTDGYTLRLKGIGDATHWTDGDLTFDSSGIAFMDLWEFEPKVGVVVLRYPVDSDGEMLCGELILSVRFETPPFVFRCFQDWTDFGNDTPESIKYIGREVFSDEGTRYVIL